MIDREREAETQAEGEAGSMQGARCGTRSRELQDRALGQRQALNRYPGIPPLVGLNTMPSMAGKKSPGKHSLHPHIQ